MTCRRAAANCRWRPKFYALFISARFFYTGPIFAMSLVNSRSAGRRQVDILAYECASRGELKP